MRCPTCGATYVVVGDDAGYVRSVCACEANNACARCKKPRVEPIAQAFLGFGTEPEEYWCVAHARPEFLPSTPPPAIPPGGVPRAPVTIVLEPDETLAGLPEEAVYEALEARAAALPPNTTTKVVCTRCGHRHTPSQRTWHRGRRYGGGPALQSHCPNCDTEGYAAY